MFLVWLWQSFATMAAIGHYCPPNTAILANSAPTLTTSATINHVDHHFGQIQEDTNHYGRRQRAVFGHSIPSTDSHNLQPFQQFWPFHLLWQFHLLWSFSAISSTLAFLLIQAHSNIWLRPLTLAVYDYSPDFGKLAYSANFGSIQQSTDFGRCADFTNFNCFESLQHWTNTWF